MMCLLRVNATYQEDLSRRVKTKPPEEWVTGDMAAGYIRNKKWLTYHRRPPSSKMKSFYNTNYSAVRTAVKFVDILNATT